MDWRTCITSDPAVLVGKPVVAGTRLSVDFILRLLAMGWTQDAVLESYPQLRVEHLRAVFELARETLED